jgi:hypothetical protein
MGETLEGRRGTVVLTLSSPLEPPPPQTQKREREILKLRRLEKNKKRTDSLDQTKIDLFPLEKVVFFLFHYRHHNHHQS